MNWSSLKAQIRIIRIFVVSEFNASQLTQFEMIILAQRSIGKPNNPDDTPGMLIDFNP